MLCESCRIDAKYEKAVEKKCLPPYLPALSFEFELRRVRSAEGRSMLTTQHDCFDGYANLGENLIPREAVKKQGSDFKV